MDCGVDDDPALGSEDQVSGFLNRLVDQSISDLIEEDETLGEFEDEQTPLPDFDNKDKKPKKKEFSSSKSLPCLKKQMDNIQKPQMSRTSSQPIVNKKLPDVDFEDLDLRRFLLTKQYRKAMVDQYINHVPVVREEPDGLRRVPITDLRYDPTESDTATDTAAYAIGNESISNQTPGQSGAASNKENADPSSSKDKVNNHINDFLDASLMEMADETAAMILMQDNENEMYKDVRQSISPVSYCKKTKKEMENELCQNERNENQRIGTVDIVKEAEKEFLKDEDGSISQQAPTVIVEKDVTDTKESLDVDETAVTAKSSSRSLFGFLFNRRRSNGSLKLRFPFHGLLCCTAQVESEDNVNDNKNHCRTKKRGFLRRVVSCLRKRGGKVAPVNDT
ncbi:uncharacterized protein [Argopecten irradians]|uniref:uncharacterized protein n=1 Tax=Argopecten irradians TaxID=31199 RepID=UPI003724202C